jgi:short-subunit dehydrogenase
MRAGRFLEQDVQLFEKSMQLDYFGTLYLVKAVLPGMVSRNAGQLLFIASPLAAIGKGPTILASEEDWLGNCLIADQIPAIRFP